MRVSGTSLYGVKESFKENYGLVVMKTLSAMGKLLPKY